MFLTGAASRPDFEELLYNEIMELINNLPDFYSDWTEKSKNDTKDGIINALKSNKN